MIIKMIIKYGRRIGNLRVLFPQTRIVVGNYEADEWSAGKSARLPSFLIFEMWPNIRAQG